MPAGMDPRQMALMMRRLGIEMEEIPDVREVVVRTGAREYRIRGPAVSVMRAQGTETWQVQGRAEVAHPAAGAPPAVPAAQPPAQPPRAPAPATPPPADDPLEADVRLVMEQTGSDEAAARRALRQSGGDIAETIVQLGG